MVNFFYFCYCRNKTEVLFFFLRDDTYLTLNDAVSDATLKVDLRIINDKTIQRYNVEYDMTVMEAAEEDAGNKKFVLDRCKLSIETKVIIDDHLMNGVLTSSVTSLQISGFTIYFINTSLEEPGLYVARECHEHTISESLTNLASYMDLAFPLFCFRDDCISKSKVYNNHLIKQKNESRSRKRSIDQVPSDPLVAKQDSTRGTWNPPRIDNAKPPAPPKNLWKSK
ncbi:hypothetical protein K501DRAFT_168606 [Backusella circina FSU 941]|nr:hypothetical protein K501DRAFT_168606 [Backusella circina FSU 941]